MPRCTVYSAKLSFMLLCLGLAISYGMAQAETESAQLLKPRPFIVGGSAANISDYPWQVAMLYGQNSEPMRMQKCGGSIFSSYWVLTAAHCVWNMQANRAVAPGDIAIVAGTSTFASGGQRFSVDKIVVHPRWSSSSSANDIALVRLTAPMQGANMQPVDLADQGATVSGDLQVTGWGDTFSGSRKGSANLLKVTVPYATNATCNQSYNNAITNQMLCAGFPAGGKGTCQGDSGGPLVIYNTGPARANAGGPFAVQVGIVSWAFGCAAATYYTVYTRVSEYRDWIATTTQEVVSLVRQDFSDCGNGNVNASDPSRVGGTVTARRLHSGKISVQVDLLRGTPLTDYQFFLKCGYLLGTLHTNPYGLGSAAFEFPSSKSGSQFAFDMYPDGAPSGNKFQSVRVMLH